MIDQRTIFEIHRLKHLGWSDRKIARALRIDRTSVKKYLKTPTAAKKRVVQGSKLDPYRELIDQLLEQDPEVSAPVVLQKLAASGFDGKITIVRDHLREKRGSRKKRKAFIRFESPPGKQMQADWGHFGSLPYGDTRRKLYALLVIEAFSRMLFVRFTHSQNQAALHQGLLDVLRGLPRRTGGRQYGHGRGRAAGSSCALQRRLSVVFAPLWYHTRGLQPGNAP